MARISKKHEALQCACTFIINESEISLSLAQLRENCRETNEMHHKKVLLPPLLTITLAVPLVSNYIHYRVQ